MSALLEFLVVFFATVALFAFGRFIFKSNWSNIAKAIGLLIAVSLWVALSSGPRRGEFGADHGILTDAIATIGIAIVGTWLFGRVGNDWRRQAGIVAGAFVLLLFMWVPRYYAGQLSVPMAGSPSIDETSHTGGGSEDPHLTRPPLRPSKSLDCADLSYEGRIAAGCP